MPTKPEATRRSRQRWDQKARFYDRLTAPMEHMIGLARGRAWVFERPLQGRVLEVGAGTGRNFRYYPAGARVVATDLSACMLARGRQRPEVRSAPRSIICSASPVKV